MLNRKEVEDSFEAVPAYIVADKRDRLGRRLGKAAMVMLLLFFVINSYVQSAKNGAALDEASRQRDTLVESQERISLTLAGQGALIVSLQNVITRQNNALRAAGLPVEPVPDLQDLIDQAMGNVEIEGPKPKVTYSPSQRRFVRSSPTPSPSPSPRANPKPQPQPHPSTSPSPSPTATRNPVSQLVCDITNVCLPPRSDNAKFPNEQSYVRLSEVDRADLSSGRGYAIFCSF